MAVRDYFSEEELASVRAATRAAEARTGGELVCVVVEQCDTYEGSLWKASTFGALAGAVAAGVWRALWDLWGGPLALWIVLPALLGAAAGLSLALLLPPLRRALITPQVLDRRVDRRAAAAFLDEEIFDTRDRTGVLLLVALFERRIRILRDAGVEDRVAVEDWDPILRNLTRELRRERPARALVHAVEACGNLLVKHGVARREPDVDELGDEPRLHNE